MSNLLKKLIVALLFVSVFFSAKLIFAKETFACTTNLECAVNPNASGCVPNPNAGPGQQKSICSTAVTTGVSNAVSNALSGSSSESNWYNQGFFEWYAKVYDSNASPPNEIFGERYTAAQVQWVVYSLISLPLNILSKTGQDAVVCFVGMVGGSATDLVTCGTKAIAFVTDVLKTLNISAFLASSNQSPPLAAQIFDTTGRPISGIGYAKVLISKLSPVSEVHAQTGYGFTALQALQKYWTGFRNMAYALIVLVTIIFAFMIMFRVKLNPQTVISVQSALPKIIGAVILATFSYAIAGFLIDLTYVVGGMFASLLQLAGFSKNAIEAYSFIVPTDVARGLGSFTIFFYMFGYVLVFAVAVIWSFITTVTQLSLFGAIVSILFVLLWVWLVILMLWYTIKIPWVLIKNLISIYISIVIAPVQIVAGALIPAIGFGQWLKKLAAELLVFPVTGLFMYLAWTTLLSSFAVNARIIGQVFGSDPGKLWAPPIIGSSADMSGLLWLAVSFGIIAMLPKVVDMMKGLIMGERFSFGTAIGEAAAPLNTVFGMPVSQFRDYMSGAGLYNLLSNPEVQKVLSRIPIVKRVQRQVVGGLEERYGKNPSNPSSTG